MKSDDEVRHAILDLTSKARSVAPREIALQLADDGIDWRVYLPRIRAVATALSHDGLVVFVRKKKVVEPAGLRGVYRLAVPQNYASEQ